MSAAINSLSVNSPAINFSRRSLELVPKCSWIVLHDEIESARTPSQSNATHSGVLIAIPSYGRRLSHLDLLKVERSREVTEGRAPGPKSWGHTPLWGFPHPLGWVFFCVQLEATHPPSKGRMRSSQSSTKVVPGS